MEAIGNNGRMILQGDNVVISRRGTGLLTALNQGMQGDKTIPIRNITAVQLKAPGLTTGYLQLSLNGRDTPGGAYAAVKDENTVLFSGSQHKIFEAFRKELQSRVDQPVRSPSSASVADEIEKLASLRDRGLLTDEEFQEQKQQLLKG